MTCKPFLVLIGLAAALGLLVGALSSPSRLSTPKFEAARTAAEQHLLHT